MKGVIYARYSHGANQTDQSIEGQLRDCYEYAEKHDITIVKEYIDRHISGTTDNREQFQMMIEDSDKKTFDCIICWKIDRFARNRYDSAIYKSRLKKNEVRVLYAKEAIPDGPEGIILESLLEGMAEYYSAELSQKIKRGIRESVYKGKAVGGCRVLGYKLTPEKTFAINEDEAFIVRNIFEWYAEGLTVTEITTRLNASGYKTSTGAQFNKNSLRKMLKNEKYIGIYTVGGITNPNGIPPIISTELFDKVQKQIARNQCASARYRAHEKYTLTGKLYCGYCGQGMVGECGTGRHGQKHYYYICKTKKHNRSECNKSIVKKDYIENLIVEETTKQILNPDRIQYVAHRCVELYEKDNSMNNELTYFQKRLSETEKSINNLMKALEQGIITKTTQSRLAELEEEKEKIEFEIENCKISQPKISEKQIIYMLSRFDKSNYKSEHEFNDSIIESLVSSVTLYDDKMIVTYNIANKNRADLLQSTLLLGAEPLSGSASASSGGAECSPSEPLYYNHGYLILICDIAA